MHLDRQLTSLAGHTVEFATAGSSGPTVVFEAGLGTGWTTWALVAEKVAAHARVFAYSRPGYGASEAVETPRDPSHVVEELRALLSVSGRAPPYVLVGHSVGGGYMELFAKAHPSEVMGLVLVDPRHRDFTAACEAQGLGALAGAADVLSKMTKVERAEYEGYAAASAQLRAAGAFGQYPVRVLIAMGRSPQDEARAALWKSMLTSLAAEATDGQALIFEGAGHGLQFERPDDVARAILALILPLPNGGERRGEGTT